MKFLIASDLHGSNFYAEKLINRFEEEKADKLVLLGDVYNHGPRNALPEDYNPMKVSEKLNGITKKLLVIKGNCDSEVDTLISDFDFVSEIVISINGKTVFLTHGHVYNEDSLPKTDFDMIFYGHFHVGFIKKVNGKIIANPGSLSLPKNDSKNSYLILDDKSITLKSIDGEVIEKSDY